MYSALLAASHLNLVDIIDVELPGNLVGHDLGRHANREHADGVLGPLSYHAEGVGAVRPVTI